jgi:hypothetical protein
MARLALVAVCVICLFGGCGNDSLVEDEEKEPSQTEVSLRHWFQQAYRWDGSLDKELPEPAKSALEQAEELELVSLDPGKPAKGENPKSTFHKRKILGTTRITDRETRRFLLAAFNEGLREANESAECFEPRHCIRVKHQGKVIEVVICFACDLGVVYIDGKLDPDLQFTTDHSPRAVFDALLSASRIQIARDWNEE